MYVYALFLRWLSYKIGSVPLYQQQKRGQTLTVAMGSEQPVKGYFS